MPYKPGESGNPAGRPLGSKNRFTLDDLKTALDKAKAKHGDVSLLDHVCDKSYEDNVLAIAILKKMLPDLQRMQAIVDIEPIGFATMTPEEACRDMDNSTVGEPDVG